jgi:hypothetical protein
VAAYGEMISMAAVTARPNRLMHVSCFGPDPGDCLQPTW